MTVKTSSCASIALMSKQAGQNTAWVHLIPAGEFFGRDGRGPYLLDEPEKVAAMTRQYAGKTQIAIDYEHQGTHSKENGKPAPAAGWVVGIETRDDGIWGLVEWTEAAAAHIAKREYRYLSPVFFHAKDGRVQALQSAALTNSPNLDHMIALNRAEEPMDKNENLNSKLKAVALLLGLGPDASQDEIAAKLKQLLPLLSDLRSLPGVSEIAAHSAIPDPSKYVPIGDFERAVKDANSLRQGVTENAAMHRVNDDVKSGQLLPYMKDWAISLCKTNMPAYESFMQRVGPAVSGMLKSSHATAHPPTFGKTSIADDQELAICARMGLTAEEYVAAR